MLIILIVGGVMALVAGAILLTDFGVQPRTRRPPDRDRLPNFHRWADRERSPNFDRSADRDRSSELDASGRRLHAVADPVDPRSHTVSVIMPTLNEAGSLAWVLEQIPSWVSEVVLVDGLSTDGTEALARRLRPDVVVVHQHQPGKGAALRAGFAAATSDIVVMIDADGSTDPREMPRFVEALAAGADLVKGSRHIEAGGSADFTRMRAAGNRGFVKLANLLYRSHFTDLCYGYCAFWRHHLDTLALSADGFEIETELVLGAVKAGLTIREVPSFELARRAGTSNLNAARDGLRVLRTMLGQRLRRRPGAPGRAARFSLREVRVSADRLRAGVDGRDRRNRRGSDRRGNHRARIGHLGPERRVGERRHVQDTVVVQRVVYESTVPQAQRQAV
ncbi:MAG: glycosyltransferase family 2 protein [Actinomycetota bacterium]|nr:glycosyltransferase family 2 protein [Actinomycetota bacterium]